MPTNQLLNNEYIQDCFDYHPGGILVFKKRPRFHFRDYATSVRWNNMFPGKQADNLFNLESRIQLRGIKTATKTLIWHFHNQPTTFRIKHINGILADNRIENLEVAAKTERLNYEYHPSHRFIYFHDTKFDRYAVCAATVDPEYFFFYAIDKKTANRVATTLNTLFK